MAPPILVRKLHPDNVVDWITAQIDARLKSFVLILRLTLLTLARRPSLGLRRPRPAYRPLPSLLQTATQRRPRHEENAGNILEAPALAE